MITLDYYMFWRMINHEPIKWNHEPIKWNHEPIKWNHEPIKCIHLLLTDSTGRCLR
jgi:hypothetical protein